MRTLRSLGWTTHFQEQLDALLDSMPGSGELVPMRVAIEHQDRYTVVGERSRHDAHLTGRMLQGANRGGPRPAAGDWVALSSPNGPICHLFRRTTAFQRMSPRGKIQVISANIDRVFVVTSCNAEFNVRRIERYLSAISQSGAQAAIVLSKIDLCDDSEFYEKQLIEIAGDAPVLPVATTQGQGLSALTPLLGAGLTIALVGSSGVGKSTLANALIGEDWLPTAAIREQDAKGRHTTTRRELVLLSNDRGVLIDTPGMRELKLSCDEDEKQSAFSDIVKLAQDCQFRNCAHLREPGCAVRGHVAAKRLQNYQVIAKEIESSRRSKKKAEFAIHKARTKRSKK